MGNAENDNKSREGRPEFSPTPLMPGFPCSPHQGISLIPKSVKRNPFAPLYPIHFKATNLADVKILPRLILLK